MKSDPSPDPPQQYSGIQRCRQSCAPALRSSGSNWTTRAATGSASVGNQLPTHCGRLDSYAACVLRVTDNHAHLHGVRVACRSAQVAPAAVDMGPCGELL